MTRRTGDTIGIDGGYQYRALTEGNAVQRFWHRSKQLAIGRYLPPEADDRVLDVGCGSGVVADFLGRFGARVLGIDASAEAVRFASRRFESENVTFRRALVDETFGEPASADKIYCLEVIEHVYPRQARRMLLGFRRLLADGGRVFLTTPNYCSFWPLIERLIDLFNLAPPLVEHQHVTFYNKARLRKLCEGSGFVVERMASACFVAPWLAPLGERLAMKADAVESRIGWLPGSVLVCVLSRR